MFKLFLFSLKSNSFDHALKILTQHSKNYLYKNQFLATPKKGKILKHEIIACKNFSDFHQKVIFEIMHYKFQQNTPINTFTRINFFFFFFLQIHVAEALKDPRATILRFQIPADFAQESYPVVSG
eukprot:TRINITY_DN12157_c0_g1_i1.p8 TRINITY_DN12157_c0_g1~~TRINITY_DN12157_c0_g1_i1.p8  ORF type:complete len:125 (-),score=8.47 TRINITY_DN12157_c0_g1_i1:374-748(-)